MISWSLVCCGLGVITVAPAFVNGIKDYDYTTFLLSKPGSVQTVNAHQDNADRRAGHVVIMPPLGRRVFVPYGERPELRLSKARDSHHVPYYCPHSYLKLPFRLPPEQAHHVHHVHEHEHRLGHHHHEQHKFHEWLNTELRHLLRQSASCEEKSDPPTKACCGIRHEFMERMVAMSQSFLNSLEGIATTCNHGRERQPCLDDSSPVTTPPRVTRRQPLRSTTTRAPTTSSPTTPLPPATEITAADSATPKPRKPHHATIHINDKGEIISSKIEYGSIDGEDTGGHEGKTLSPEILAMLPGLKHGSLKMNEDNVEDPLKSRGAPVGRSGLSPDVGVPNLGDRKVTARANPVLVDRLNRIYNLLE